MTYEKIDGLDINATDTVFRNAATGRFVKVRVVRAPSPPGLEFGLAVFEVSGAHCDADGRAMLRPGRTDAWQIAPKQRLTVHTDKPANIAAVLAEIRQRVAAATENAVEMEEALAAGA